jgi:Bacterial regulatory proteins, tetR family
MPRSPAEKLLTSLPKVTGASRRQQYSASTKKALVEVATEQFSERGYGGTSLDSIVAGARVTKGAPSREPCAARPTRGRRRAPACGRSSPSCSSPSTSGW